MTDVIASGMKWKFDRMDKSLFEAVRTLQTVRQSIEELDAAILNDPTFAPLLTNVLNAQHEAWTALVNRVESEMTRLEAQRLREAGRPDLAEWYEGLTSSATDDDTPDKKGRQ